MKKNMLAIYFIFFICLWDPTKAHGMEMSRSVEEHEDDNIYDEIAVDQEESPQLPQPAGQVMTTNNTRAKNTSLCRRILCDPRTLALGCGAGLCLASPAFVALYYSSFSATILAARILFPIEATLFGCSGCGLCGIPVLALLESN
jgi:hypothetical protein